MKKAFGWSVLIVASACIIFLAGIFLGRTTTTDPTATAPSIEVIYISEPSNVRININTADADDLQQLPGIGEVIAQRIIDHRTAIGHFTSVQQLDDVEGIGIATIEKIMHLICLED